MRLKERERIAVEIAARACVEGPLGSVSSGFSDERIRVRASVLPESGAYGIRENGLKSGEGLRLLVPADSVVSEGDGVWVEGKGYEVISVRKWRAHAELECAKML